MTTFGLVALSVVAIMALPSPLAAQSANDIESRVTHG